MSTRKLIITALLCGMAILVAGGLKLFLTATDRAEPQVLALGESATLGDMTVRVDAVDVAPGVTLVTVSMQGVDGADAVSGWRLLAGGEVHEPVVVPADAGMPCTTTAATVRTVCLIAFDATEGTRTVAYLRAGTQRQWAP